MSSQVCWRCGVDPGSWSRINNRVWCNDCLDIALSTFVVLAVFDVPLFAVVKAATDEHVAREVVKALEKPAPKPERHCALSGWTIMPNGRCNRHTEGARCPL